MEDLEGWTTIGTINGAPVSVGPAEPQWWHVAWCLDCTDGVTGEMPFPSQEARTEWVNAHQEGTGHKAWRLVSVRRDFVA